MSGSNPDTQTGNATINVVGSALGTELQQLLMSDDIHPGTPPSYQLCKTIFLYHPLGRKLAEAPMALAQSQPRAITISDAPEEVVREQFVREWTALGADGIIFNTMRTARIYGASALAMLAKGVDSYEPIAPEKLADLEISFNVYDPLNTSGSMVYDQNPSTMDFQKVNHVEIQGDVYHRSRTVVVLNEEPIYLAYTNSAFGYVGRSVYQRALFPLKSYVKTMIANDMIATKLGLLIAKMVQPGSIIDRFMQGLASIKRNLLKEAGTGNVLSISPEESIETLNMQNVDGAGSFSRDNILKDIATAADMPASVVNQETMVGGFGEGTEDAKNIARWVDGERIKMNPLYDFMDKICMRRAWNEEFYKTVQARFPEYEKITYTQAFYRWSNSFKPEWPSLLIEPDSEKSKTEDVKLKSVVALVEVFLPTLDPENKATLLIWAADNFNSLKLLFSDPLHLDYEMLKDFLEEQKDKAEQMPAPGEGAEKEPEAPNPFAAAA